MLVRVSGVIRGKSRTCDSPMTRTDEILTVDILFEMLLYFFDFLDIIE